ncbi:MAG: TorF family putative porin [bacterium]
MNKIVVSVVVALAVAAPAFAADMPVKTVKAPAVAAPATPPFDVAFGASFGTDYNFRGVSQSNRKWSASAYAEPQFNTAIGQLYAGVAISRIDWPNTPAYAFTDPSAEVDLYGGWRNNWGALSIDLGGIYYYYPSEKFNGLTSQSDFWEVYAKAAYAVTPDLTLGANIFYTPDLLHYSTSVTASGGTGKPDAVYASLTGKWVTPWKVGDLGSFISGELGHWWIDDKPFRTSGYANDPSYTYWNVGAALTYKVATLDFRYHGNSLSRAECATFLFSAVGNPSNKWCGDAFIVTAKFDTTFSSLSALK